MRDSIIFNSENGRGKIIASFDITGVHPDATDDNIRSFVTAVLKLTDMYITSVYRIHAYSVYQ